LWEIGQGDGQSVYGAPHSSSRIRKLTSCPGRRLPDGAFDLCPSALIPPLEFNNAFSSVKQRWRPFATGAGNADRQANPASAVPPGFRIRSMTLSEAALTM
jgi:hypothetical protein